MKVRPIADYDIMVAVVENAVNLYQYPAGSLAHTKPHTLLWVEYKPEDGDPISANAYIMDGKHLPVSPVSSKILAGPVKKSITERVQAYLKHLVELDPEHRKALEILLKVTGEDAKTITGMEGDPVKNKEDALAWMLKLKYFWNPDFQFWYREQPQPAE